MHALMYHGVVDAPDDSDYYAANFARVRDFEQQARELKRHWAVMSLGEVHEHLRAGRPLPSRAVHISFDDGYRNNLVAAEILDRHRLPWTLFAVTSAVLDGYQPGYIRLADAVSATGGTVSWDGDEFDLRSNDDKWRFVQRVKPRIMDAPAPDYVDQIEAVLDGAALQRPGRSRWPFLDARELCELHAAGVEIGNHSARHLNLTRCDAEWLREEIDASQVRLARTLGGPVRFFAYPDGRYDDHVTRAVAASHDLAMAVTTPDTPLAPMRIRREPVGGRADEFRAVLGRPARFRRPGLRARATRRRDACAS